MSVVQAPETQGHPRHDMCMREFDQAFHEAQKRWESIHADPPRLYHYTTMAGLMGIVETSRIRASDARFMNDASELTYAAHIIDEALEEVLEGESDERLQTSLSKCSGFTSVFDFGPRPFVACFCAVDDLLSQWRGYGQGVAPAALGLDLSILVDEKKLPPATHLRKVIMTQPNSGAL